MFWLPVNCVIFLKLWYLATLSSRMCGKVAWIYPTVSSRKRKTASARAGPWSRLHLCETQPTTSHTPPPPHQLPNKVCIITTLFCGNNKLVQRVTRLKNFLGNCQGTSSKMLNFAKEKQQLSSLRWICLQYNIWISKSFVDQWEL